MINRVGGSDEAYGTYFGDKRLDRSIYLVFISCVESEEDREEVPKTVAANLRRHSPVTSQLRRETDHGGTPAGSMLACVIQAVHR